MQALNQTFFNLFLFLFRFSDLDVKIIYSSPVFSPDFPLILSLSLQFERLSGYRPGRTSDVLAGQQTGDAGALLCLPCAVWPVAICHDLP